MADSLDEKSTLPDLKFYILNDANFRTPYSMAKESSEKNNLENVKFSNQEACSFLSEHSETGMRAMAADVDPFGSPKIL